MKVKTFYTITNDNGQVLHGTYREGEITMARKKLEETARENLNLRFHLMKRVCSVTCPDTVWEDSE